MNTDKYRVKVGKKVKLQDFPTSYNGSLTKEEVYEQLLPANQEKLAQYQEALYAENRRGLIIILQAMDAAGKDGTIEHVFSALNPQGTVVTPFKEPSDEELDHDYLWRAFRALPRRGNIAVFNRSHYEDVLVTRVHNLLPKQQIPEFLVDDQIWNRRFREISNFEQYLTDNGFTIVKFFLHISKEEQKQRLLARIEEEEKNWKFSASDVSERRYWSEYQEAYEDLLAHTSTESCPWYVIPADRKWFSRYLVSEIMVDVFEKIDPQFPELPPEEKAHLERWKEVLENDD
ncbi:MAG: polyphosphate kinase 2 family protein [Tissierellia bacterium]|nr:polyphosphate kinase 2 family protein [Tissierellia bacterium]